MRARSATRALAAVSIAVVAMATATAAHAATTSHEEGHNVAVTERTIDPCTGAPGTATGIVNIGTESTQTSTGLHMTFHMTGTDSFQPDDPSGVSYFGRDTYVAHANVNPSGTQTLMSNFNARLNGSDGSLETGHVLVHLTATADGSVTASVDQFTITCN